MVTRQNKATTAVMMRAVQFWVVLSGAVLICAMSNPPSPSSGVSDIAANAPKEHVSPNNGHEAGQSDQSGTNTNPIFVKLVHTDESDAESNQEAKRVADKDAFDVSSTKWTIGLTVVLAVATILQFIALIFQGWWLRKSVKSAEKALNDVERPYIFIFGIKDICNTEYEGHEWPIVKYTLSNSGRTPAIINAVWTDLAWGKSIPNSMVRAPDNHDLIVSPVLAADENRSIFSDGRALHVDAEHIADSLRGGNYVSNDESQWFDYWIPRQRTDEFSLYLRITVEYTGPFTKEHRTSGCWVYDIGQNCFRVCGDEKYNCRT